MSSGLDGGSLRELLFPFTILDGSPVPVTEGVFTAFAEYLDLLVRWNTRTNLTAVRDPEQMARRHLGESLFAALWLSKGRTGACTLLDLGSGAGLPGIPIQIVQPEWQVTLAESQGKKVAFLREAVRLLSLRAQVWPARAEAMPTERRFDVVTMRAVDRMGAMREVALARVKPGGLLLEMVGGAEPEEGWIPIPSRRASFLRVTQL